MTLTRHSGKSFAGVTECRRARGLDQEWLNWKHTILGQICLSPIVVILNLSVSVLMNIGSRPRNNSSICSGILRVICCQLLRQMLFLLLLPPLSAYIQTAELFWINPPLADTRRGIRVDLMRVVKRVVVRMPVDSSYSRLLPTTILATMMLHVERNQSAIFLSIGPDVTLKII